MDQLSRSEKGRAAPGPFWQKVVVRSTNNPWLCTCTLVKSLIREAMHSTDCCVLSTEPTVLSTDCIFTVSRHFYLYLSLLKKEKKKKKIDAFPTGRALFPTEFNSCVLFNPRIFDLKTPQPVDSVDGIFKVIHALT